MKERIIAVEVTGEHIIKGVGGNGYIVDHNHYYIRVQLFETYNWETLGICYPKTENGKKQAIEKARSISAANGNITIFMNGYSI